MKKYLLISIAVLLLLTACDFSIPISLSALLVRQALNKVELEEVIANCEDESCLDLCLSRIDSKLKFNPLPSDQKIATTEQDVDLIMYRVNQGRLSEPVLMKSPANYAPFQEDLESPQKTWEYFSAILPKSEMKWFKYFIVYTDGPEGYAAWVSGADDEPNKWKLAVDVLNTHDPFSLTTILTHEAGHVITLNSEQIDYDPDFYDDEEFKCDTFLYRWDCPKEDSYVNKFYLMFWHDIYQDWEKEVNHLPYNADEKPEDLVHRFYLKHKEQFKEEYAATNLGEDMAVSFTSFVLESPPSGDSIPEQKVNFFYQFPELVQMRKEMIKGICSYVK